MGKFGMAPGNMPAKIWQRSCMACLTGTQTLAVGSQGSEVIYLFSILMCAKRYSSIDRCSLAYPTCLSQIQIISPLSPEKHPGLNTNAFQMKQVFSMPWSRKEGSTQWCIIHTSKANLSQAIQWNSTSERLRILQTFSRHSTKKKSSCFSYQYFSSSDAP